MIDKYKNKYRIQSNRLQYYDYGANGCYFVTICTKNSVHYFGEIETHNYDEIVETHNYASLRKTTISEIAEKFWFEIPNHFPFVVLDQFVIMPNHIHGILFFENVETHNYGKNVETHNYASLQNPNNYNKFGPQSKNLGSVIRGFKSSLKRYANENNIDFAWQSRFYDRIIRNDDELNNVRKYILYNPLNWNDDEYNTVKMKNINRCRDAMHCVSTIIK